MSSRKSSFSIYIDLNTSKNSENSVLPSSPPTKKPRIQVEIQPMITRWYNEPLREIAPNFARPTNPTWTMARLQEKTISLGSLKKWQKNQPNDHTSKLFLILLVLYSSY